MTRVIKPIELSLLTRPFEVEGQHCLVTTIMAGIILNESKGLLPEAHIWKNAQAALGSQALLDEGMPKLHGELLVAGNVCALAAKKIDRMAVSVNLGLLRKRLQVTGHRYWLYTKASAPVPFAKLPLDWTHSFGGAGFEANPLGKGATAIETTKGPVQPLPNVEAPRHLVNTPDDRPPPAGLSPIPPHFPQRAQHLGSYDETWLKTRFPGFPADFDPRYFQLAPADQWLEQGQYFKGDESFSVTGMHPEHPRIEGRLPGIRARAFVTRKGEPLGALEEATTRLDTVWLFPGQLTAVLIFRGLIETSEDDAADIATLMCAFERLDENKPLSHYQQALARRLDPDKGYLYVLRDKELLPSGFASALDDMVDLSPEGDDDLLGRHMSNRVQAELEKVRQQLRDQGLDPDEHGVPATLPEDDALGLDMPTSLDELPDFLDRLDEKTDELEKDAERRRTEAEQKVREAMAAQGMDYDQMVADAEKRSGGPPEFSAQKELERLQAQLELSRNAGIPLPEVEKRLSDPELAETLMEAERSQIDAYRQFAHFFPAAQQLGGDEAQRLRQEVEHALSQRQSLAERDLTGADLSGLDLSGVDLSRAFLEKADLRGCKLRGATLRQTVLARANLSQADLSGANLNEANLGEAQLTGATLKRADLTKAVLFRADLAQADLSEAILTEADVHEVRLNGTDLSGVKARSMRFIEVEFTDVNFSEADLEESLFIESKLLRCDFSGAHMSRCVFVKCHATKSRFAHAQAKNLCILKESVFDGALFEKADVRQACLRGASLRGADFSGALLDQADFSEADCTRARFEGSTARESLFNKTCLERANLTDCNLMLAMMQKAKLAGTDFLGANLVRANLLGAIGDKRTRFQEALMLETVHRGLL